MKNTKLFRVSLIGALSVFMLSEIISCNSSQQSGQPGEEWKAPGDASNVANPLPDNATTLQKGKETYNLYCATCHGETGFGNGPARGPLGDQPANFHQTIRLRPKRICMENKGKKNQEYFSHNLIF